MRDLGILESLIDPELDGFGGTALDISTVFEALGRGLVVEPFLEVGILAAKVLSKEMMFKNRLLKRFLKRVFTYLSPQRDRYRVLEKFCRNETICRS